MFRLIWPPGESDHLHPQTGVPTWIGWGRAHSILLTRRKNQNAQSSKWFAEGWVCILQQVPIVTTPQKTFNPRNRVPFHFFGPKNQKVDLKVPFSNSKNSIIFNDLLAVASEHKSEKFFFVFKFLKIFENFNIFKKKNLIPPWATTVICISKRS